MLKLLFIASFALLLSACAADGPAWQGKACNEQLNLAYKQLYDIKHNTNVDGTEDWTEASAILTAAQTDYETGNYYLCLKRVKEALVHIRKSES